MQQQSAPVPTERLLFSSEAKRNIVVILLEENQIATSDRLQWGILEEDGLPFLLIEQKSVVRHRWFFEQAQRMHLIAACTPLTAGDEPSQ